MTNSETYDWIRREILGRWPDCELTQAMKDDLYKGLYNVTEEVATKAVIEHRADTQSKYPNASRICRIANLLMKQERPKTEKKWNNVEITGVYLGGANRNIVIGSRYTTVFRIPTEINLESVQSEILDKVRTEVAAQYGPDARFELYLDFVQAMKRSSEIWDS